ncbi:MAG: radical SAM protein [Candidatus Omnitrophica bacterium]|nr:radical SAM protein [Candidatus Omnitrophota bacterium]MDD5690513.1 radical SAM protein [Candidatus Omnitrophota bacterium]
MYRPRICSIELFRRCCLRCRMCNMWKVKEDDKGLDKDTLEHLACGLLSVMNGEKEVVLSGGEPLLHSDIVEIIRQFSLKGFKVGMASNGVLIDQAKAGELAGAGLKNIQLSLDSVNKETHDFLRGVPGAYEKVLQAAGYLKVHKGKVSVCAQTVISGKNLEELVDTIEFIKDDGRFDAISFMAVTTPFFATIDNDWQENSEFSFLWPCDSKRVDKIIDQIIALKAKGYPIANPVAQFELFRSYFHQPRKRRQMARCQLGDYVVSIDPSGEVRICCFMDSVGNIYVNDITLLLDNPQVEKMRQDMRACSKVCNTLVNCFFKA